MDVNENESDPFHESYHHSNLRDVYALYNAVNGETVGGGRLDVTRLDELSEDERKTLDIARLREVWKHTADCPTCVHIVRTLNTARRILGKGETAMPEAGLKR